MNIRPESLRRQLEKSNDSRQPDDPSATIFAKYAITSSPKKFLLHTSDFILVSYNISHKA